MATGIFFFDAKLSQSLHNGRPFHAIKRFLQMLGLDSKVKGVGQTSFKIQVDAYAEGRHTAPRLACVATLVMVSVKKDSQGQYHKTPHGQSC